MIHIFQPPLSHRWGVWLSCLQRSPTAPAANVIYASTPVLRPFREGKSRKQWESAANRPTGISCLSSLTKEASLLPVVPRQTADHTRIVEYMQIRFSKMTWNILHTIYHHALFFILQIYWLLLFFKVNYCASFSLYICSVIRFWQFSFYFVLSMLKTSHVSMFSC